MYVFIIQVCKFFLICLFYLQTYYLIPYFLVTNLNKHDKQHKENGITMHIFISKNYSIYNFSYSNYYCIHWLVCLSFLFKKRIIMNEIENFEYRNVLKFSQSKEKRRCLKVRLLYYLIKPVVKTDQNIEH